MSDDIDTIVKKLAKAPTDSGKGAEVPKTGSVANLLKFVELFEGTEKRQKYELDYLGQGVRYGDLKKSLAEAIFAELKPIQEKRKELEQNLEYVDQVIAQGREKSRAIAEATVAEVRQKMGLR